MRYDPWNAIHVKLTPRRVANIRAAREQGRNPKNDTGIVPAHAHLLNEDFDAVTPLEAQDIARITKTGGDE